MDYIEKTMIDYLKEQGIESGMHSKISENMDSIEYVKFLIMLENKYDIEFDLDVFDENVTFFNVLHYIKELQNV